MKLDQSRIFVSYSRTDSEFTLRLIEDLKAHEINIWLDQIELRAGQNWPEEIEKALITSGKFVIILTADSVASRNVMDELNYAIEENKEIIPVLLKSCKIPFRIGSLHYIDFTRDYNKGLKATLQSFNVSETVIKIPKTDGYLPISRKNFIKFSSGLGAITILVYFGFAPIRRLFRQAQQPSNGGFNKQEVLKEKEHHIYRKRSVKTNYSSKDFKNLLTINKKSEIAHYFNINGLTLSTTSFSDIDKFKSFEENLEILNDYSILYGESGKPRFTKGHHSWNAEECALNLIQQRKYLDASKILLSVIKHNKSVNYLSYRLYDLMAVLCTRHSDKISDTFFQDLIEISLNTNNELLLRAKKWSETDWRKKIIAKKNYYFNKVLI